MVKPIDLSRILKIQLDFNCLHIYMHVLHIYCSQLSSEKKLHYEIIPKGKYSLNAALTCEFTCIIYIKKNQQTPMRTREFHYRCDTNKKIHCGEV